MIKNIDRNESASEITEFVSESTDSIFHSLPPKKTV